MTTTTPTAIIAQLVAIIEALPPSAASAVPFRRSTAPRRPVRSPEDNVDMVRRFDLRRDGAREDMGIQHPEVNLVAVPLTLTVAYPAVPKLYELTELYDLEALIESDALQLRDLVAGPSALVAGHQANLTPRIEPLNRGDERCWFQDITLTAVFYTAQVLT